MMEVFNTNNIIHSNTDVNDYDEIVIFVKDYNESGIIHWNTGVKDYDENIIIHSNYADANDYDESVIYQFKQQCYRL